MRTIIAGGRDFIGTREHYEWLLGLKEKIPITVVLCGEARGADTFGKEWALENDLPVESYHANWNVLGKRAGYVRNLEMAKKAEACILFPGGKGTQMMEQLATSYGLKTYKWSNLHDPL